MRDILEDALEVAMEIGLGIFMLTSICIGTVVSILIAYYIIGWVYKGLFIG